MWSLYPNCNSPNLSLLQNENENENKINPNRSVNTRVIQFKRLKYVKHIGSDKFSFLNSTKFVTI